MSALDYALARPAVQAAAIITAVAIKATAFAALVYESTRNGGGALVPSLFFGAVLAAAVILEIDAVRRGRRIANLANKGELLTLEAAGLVRGLGFTLIALMTVLALGMVGGGLLVRAAPAVVAPLLAPLAAVGVVSTALRIIAGGLRRAAALDAESQLIV